MTLNSEITDKPVALGFQIELESNWIEGENRRTRRKTSRRTRRKTSRSKDENQQQTQPTFDAESGNRTRATLVGGLCGRQMLNHCAIPAPRN